MNLHRILIRAFLLLVTATCSPLAQSDDDNVHRYFFDTLSTGDVQPTPIGVEEMKYVGNQYITANDSSLMRYVTRIVQRDIDFYADFELVEIDSFYIKTYEIKEMTPRGWMRLGADYLIKLEAEFPGRNLRVRWRLMDTARRQQIDRGKIERPKSDWRLLGHEIADEIVHTLTGEEGIFTTRIAYAQKSSKGKEIFIADYDGAHEQQLTNNKSINISPAFSPDGKSVYYTSYVSGDPQLYRADVRTGENELIMESPGIVAAPNVSPDGDKIACVLSRDGNSEIYLIDLRGKVIKRLTNHRSIDTAPTWSPDGRLIAFTSDRNGRNQIYIMDSYGMNLRRLTFQGNYNDSPVWSRAGDRITFVSRTKSGRFDLASIDTSGADYRILTEVGMNENPHFSPDGKHIVFSSTRLGPRDLFTMDITGRNQRRLTRSGKCSNPVWGPYP